MVKQCEACGLEPVDCVCRPDTVEGRAEQLAKLRELREKATWDQQGPWLDDGGYRVRVAVPAAYAAEHDTDDYPLCVTESKHCDAPGDPVRWIVAIHNLAPLLFERLERLNARSTTRPDLRRLAEKATPGRWAAGKVKYGEDLVHLVDDNGGIVDDDPVVCQTRRYLGSHDGGDFNTKYAYADAEFIAAANPQTVLALLDELDTAHHERDELHEKVKALVRYLRPSSRGADQDTADKLCEMIGVPR